MLDNFRSPAFLYFQITADTGLPLHEIAAVLGHKSLQMTQRYAHLAPDHVARASGVLGARVMGGRGGSDLDG